ncbi:Trihelix transcription factor [Trema orientale]|uniref:Trihelix transcription factor n=1 Tax=Trema orientale TaxID=63057 RepID=A0A2P5F6R2_TREOI|nr:Trihelix transcription factor [Trema orientale]
MEEEDEIQSHLSPGSGSPASPRPVGRITVTVAAAPPQQPAPQNALTLALPIQQTRNGGGGGGGGGGGVGGGGREDCWSEGATSVLIDAWGERYLELSRGNLKQKHWKEVADIVSGRDDYTKAPKTDIQCKNRIDTVKKKYKLEKAKLSSGGGPSKWPFYDRLDHLIGPTVKIASAGGHNAMAVSSQQTHKVPLGIPVGVRGSSPYQGQRDQKPHIQPVQLKNQKMQFKRRGPVDSGSSREASPASTDSFPMDFYERKRPRIGREMNLNANSNPGRVGGGTLRAGREKKGWGSAVKELTQAILKFGEAYEHAESSKLQQVVEMEKQRMKFAKELELQRMQFFMKTQLEITQLKHGRRGGIGNASNHHSNNNNNNSDSSN